jgi:hypothetical protein
MEALGQMTLSIAQEYTQLPGPRFKSQGPMSGEEFRESILEPRFKEAQNRGDVLMVDLDGGYGYGTSFLEESFGGLARVYGVDAVMKTLAFKSEEEPYLADDIKRYIRDCRGKSHK